MAQRGAGSIHLGAKAEEWKFTADQKISTKGNHAGKRKLNPEAGSKGKQGPDKYMSNVI